MLHHATRTAIALARNWSAPRVSPTDEVLIGARAWPWYCDFNIHLNAAQYLTYFEFGRWSWVVRTGLVPRLRQLRCGVVLAGGSLVYRREVPLMSRFTVVTRLVATDTRSSTFEQRIVLPSGQLACHAYQRVIARGRAGIIPPSAILDTQWMPEPPAPLRAWLSSQDEILSEAK